ncbi:MAG: hypothetical protein JWN25_2000 [Verrucomicrobiales bacterium]|nr:hypothetical protein [Verrucomicrobiales bacterium]MDB6130675.1 hypothetical protein [Verrucomicrobiales bacterium]
MKLVERDRTFARHLGMNLLLVPISALLMGTEMNVLAVAASEHPKQNTNFTFYGDFRVRYELDYDSQTAAGVARADRNRGRIRARLGFNFQVSEDWSVGARVRTGSSKGQQSSHLSFANDDGTAEDFDLVPDRYFVQFKRDGFTAWGGRNTSPFWYQNEMFWDDDATPTGLAGSYALHVGDGNLTAAGGAFYLPAGGYDLNGQMLAGQLKYNHPVGPSQVTAAAGLYYMHGEKGARYLLNRNGERDYLIGTASAQWSAPVKGIPLSLGADVFHNFMDYSAADVAPFPVVDANQTLGYVFSVQLGQLKKRNDWLLGYYYVHIETFSVNASYAQDDWVRFSSGAQTDSSNFKGHEIRGAYAITKDLNLMARLYLVDAITTVQDGNRFRVDLNWKF